MKLQVEKSNLLCFARTLIREGRYVGWKSEWRPGDFTGEQFRLSRT